MKHRHLYNIVADYGARQCSRCKYFNVKIKAGQFWKDIGWEAV